MRNVLLESTNYHTTFTETRKISVVYSNAIYSAVQSIDHFYIGLPCKKYTMLLHSSVLQKHAPISRTCVCGDTRIQRLQTNVALPFPHFPQFLHVHDLNYQLLPPITGCNFINFTILTHNQVLLCTA